MDKTLFSVELEPGYVMTKRLLPAESQWKIVKLYDCINKEMI